MNFHQLIHVQSTNPVETPWERLWTKKRYQLETPITDLSDWSYYRFRGVFDNNDPLYLDNNYYKTKDITRNWCGCVGVLWMIEYNIYEKCNTVTPTFSQLIIQYSVRNAFENDLGRSWHILLPTPNATI